MVEVKRKEGRKMRNPSPCSCVRGISESSQWLLVVTAVCSFFASETSIDQSIYRSLTHSSTGFLKVD